MLCRMEVARGNDTLSEVRCREWYRELCKAICTPADKVEDAPEDEEDADAAIHEPEANEPVLSVSDTESEPLR